jgi:tRNA(Arg) A34 adenosine deaminase TadA
MMLKPVRRNDLSPLDSRTTRRRFLATSASGAGLLAAARSASAATGNGTIEQPSQPTDKFFIQRAFEMRNLATSYGDQAYGAVVVRDNQIIGQSWSRVILDQDPTAHAEMAAIRDAALRLKSRDLGKAVLYSSSRPCPMCEAGSYWAGIIKMIHGKDLQDAGQPRLCR